MQFSLGEKYNKLRILLFNRIYNFFPLWRLSMCKKNKIILSVILFTLIPALLTYSARSVSFLDNLKSAGFIGGHVNLIILKDYLLLAEIIFSALLLSVNLTFTTLKKNSLLEQRNSLIKLSKYIFLRGLEKATEISHIDMNIRIFVPHKNKILVFNRFININIGNEIEFELIYISGLNEIDDVQNLKFQVFPISEGLVGKCYKNKYINYDTNIKLNSITKYNFSNYQKSKLINIEFYLCCPIFNKNETIVSIIVFESAQKLEITKETEPIWHDFILGFSQSLYDYVPELFK